MQIQIRPHPYVAGYAYGNVVSGGMFNPWYLLIPIVGDDHAKILPILKECVPSPDDWQLLGSATDSHLFTLVRCPAESYWHFEPDGGVLGTYPSPFNKLFQHNWAFPLGHGHPTDPERVVDQPDVEVIWSGPYPSPNRTTALFEAETAATIRSVMAGLGQAYGRPNIVLSVNIVRP